MKLRSAAVLMVFAPFLGCGGRASTPAARSAARADVRAATPAVRAATSPTVEAPTAIPFGEARIDRMNRVHDVLASSLTGWKLTNVGTDCTLVFDALDQWLVGCDVASAPKGYAPTSEAVLGRPILWRGDAVTIGDKHMAYADVKLGLVGTVTQQERDDGAKTPVLVLQDWDALHANHPGFQQSSVDEWTGIAIHEAFHAHQMWHPKVRARIDAWAKETSPATKDAPARPAPASTDDLGKFYRSNAAFARAVDDELAILRKATEVSKTPADARKALHEWLRLRETRRNAFASALETAYPNARAWEMDGFYTFLEGTARYVEATYRLASAEGKGLTPTTIPGLSGGGAKYVYAIGMYVSFLLDRIDPTWKARVCDDDELLIGVATKLAAR